jgi:hypothetical protein
LTHASCNSLTVSGTLWQSAGVFSGGNAELKDAEGVIGDRADKRAL